MASTTFKKAPLNRPNALGTLDASTHPSGINNSETSITLNSGDGAKFPTVAPFWITIFVDDQDVNEICEVTANPVGDTFGTIDRGEQGTGAAAWGGGGDTVNVAMLMTRDQFTDIQTAVNNIEDGTTVLASVTVDGDIIAAVGNTTVAVINTVATTVNFAGAASTALNVGHASGTTTLLGILDLSGSGILTTVKGTLNVDEAATFAGDISQVHSGVSTIIIESTDNNASLTIDSFDDKTADIRFKEDGTAKFRLRYVNSPDRFDFFTDIGVDTIVTSIDALTGEWTFLFNTLFSGADVTVDDGHYMSTQTTEPTGDLTGTTLNDGAGSGAVFAVTAGSTDSAGSFTITAGNGTPGVGKAGKLVFNTAFAAAPIAIVVTAKDVDGVDREVYITGASTTGFDVNFNGALAASEVVEFYYQVIG